MAKPPIRVSVNKAKLHQINIRFGLMNEAALDAAKESYKEITTGIKETSQMLVPRKTGALHASAYRRIARRAKDIHAEVGYDKSGELGYAWIRHQEPAKKYTSPNTTHQYLILAFNQYEDLVVDIVRVTFRKRLRKLGFKETTTGGFVSGML
jgi:hypothetical protein